MPEGCSYNTKGSRGSAVSFRLRQSIDSDFDSPELAEGRIPNSEFVFLSSVL